MAKIFTRVVYEWADGRPVMVDSDSYEYTGPMAMCDAGTLLMLKGVASAVGIAGGIKSLFSEPPEQQQAQAAPVAAAAAQAPAPAAAPVVEAPAAMPIPDDALVKRQALRAMQQRRLSAGVYGSQDSRGTADTLG